MSVSHRHVNSRAPELFVLSEREFEKKWEHVICGYLRRSECTNLHVKLIQTIALYFYFGDSISCVINPSVRTQICLRTQSISFPGIQREFDGQTLQFGSVWNANYNQTLMDKERVLSWTLDFTYAEDSPRKFGPFNITLGPLSARKYWTHRLWDGQSHVDIQFSPSTSLGSILLPATSGATAYLQNGTSNENVGEWSLDCPQNEWILKVMCHVKEKEEHWSVQWAEQRTQKVFVVRGRQLLRNRCLGVTLWDPISLQLIEFENIKVE